MVSWNLTSETSKNKNSLEIVNDEILNLNKNLLGEVGGMKVYIESTCNAYNFVQGRSAMGTCYVDEPILWVLTHCLHYYVASTNCGDSGARDIGPSCWSFWAIAWQHLQQWCKQGLLYVAAVFLCFGVVCFIVLFLFFIVYFFRNRNMISISIVEFGYYVVWIL